MKTPSCSSFWKQQQFFENCINALPILGSKGREPRNGTFMSSAIFCPPPVEAGKIWVDTCQVAEDNSIYLYRHSEPLRANVYNLYTYFVYIMREQIKIFIYSDLNILSNWNSCSQLVQLVEWWNNMKIIWMFFFPIVQRYFIRSVVSTVLWYKILNTTCIF